MGKHSRKSSDSVSRRNKKVKKERRDAHKDDRDRGSKPREFVFKPRTNWSKEQKTIEEIDPEELKQAKSDYIREDSSLMQSYNIQDAQKKLFKELISKNQKVDVQAIPTSDSNYPQPLPIIKRESATFYYRGHIPGVMNVLLDNTKIKRKINIPTHTGFNYAGLIIGPKGANQKRLEEETGCKILVRGRGRFTRVSKGRPTASSRRLGAHACPYCR